MLGQLRVFDFILICLILYLVFKNKSLEKMTSSGTPSQQDIVSSENLLAIKNLGKLAQQMISPDGGTLTLPYNVNINGDLNMTGKIDTVRTRELSILSSKKGAKVIGSRLGNILDESFAGYETSGNANFALNNYLDNDKEICKITALKHPSFTGLILKNNHGAKIKTNSNIETSGNIQTPKIYVNDGEITKTDAYFRFNGKIEADELYSRNDVVTKGLVPHPDNKDRLKGNFDPIVVPAGTAIVTRSKNISKDNKIEYGGLFLTHSGSGTIVENKRVHTIDRPNYGHLTYLP